MVGKTVIFEGEFYTVVSEAIAESTFKDVVTFTPMLRLHKVETTICKPNFVCVYVPLAYCYFPSSNITWVGSDWSEGMPNA